MNEEVIHKFNSLSIAEKATLVNNYGKTIHFTDYKGYRVSVFEIDAAIIEVWYDLEARAIWRIRMPKYEELDIHLTNLNFRYEY